MTASKKKPIKASHPMSLKVGDKVAGGEMIECPLCHRTVLLRASCDLIATHAHTPMVGDSCEASGKSLDDIKAMLLLKKHARGCPAINGGSCFCK